MPKERDYLGFLGIAVAATIWGSNGVIVNWVHLPSATVAFFRVLFASLSLLAGIVLTRKWALLRVRKAWKGLVAPGVILGGSWIFFFQSMRLIPIAETVLLNYTGPVFVACMAPVLLKEKFEKRALTPLAVSVVGILLISLPQVSFESTPQSFLGNVFGLVAGLFYAVFIVVSKKTLTGVSSYSTAFYSYAVAAALLTPSLISVDLSIDASSWILLLVMGILNTAFAVTLYYRGLSVLKAQEAVVLTYLEPVSAMVFGYLLLSQQPTITMIMGGALIIAAGYVLAYRRK